MASVVGEDGGGGGEREGQLGEVGGRGRKIEGWVERVRLKEERRREVVECGKVVFTYW